MDTGLAHTRVGLSTSMDSDSTLITLEIVPACALPLLVCPCKQWYTKDTMYLTSSTQICITTIDLCASCFCTYDSAAFHNLHLLLMERWMYGKPSPSPFRGLRCSTCHPQEQEGQCTGAHLQPLLPCACVEASPPEPLSLRRELFALLEGAAQQVGVEIIGCTAVRDKPLTS